MFGPHPAEIYAMQERQRLQIEEDETARLRRREQEESIQRFVVAEQGGPLHMKQSHWSHTRASLLLSDSWDFVPVELDIERQLSLYASISYTPTLSDSERSVYAFEVKHEAMLDWYIQDSLDRDAWFTLSNGTLNSDQLSGCARITSPLGSHVRIALRSRIVTVPSTEGHVKHRKPCPEVLPNKECYLDHYSLIIDAINLHVLARGV